MKERMESGRHKKNTTYTNICFLASGISFQLAENKLKRLHKSKQSKPSDEGIERERERETCRERQGHDEANLMIHYFLYSP